MRVIVTGGAGFIGGYLVPELEAHGHRVLVVDRHHHPRLEAAGLAEYLRDWPADVVVHMAAKIGRLLCEAEPEEAVRANVELTATVARACAEHGARLVYFSTSEVYGDHGEEVCSEEGGPFSLPHNVYGLTKRQGEEVARLYAPEGLLIVRPVMTYGPGLPTGYGRAAISNFLLWALRGEELPVHAGSERSWCWIGDIVAAVRTLLEQERSGAYNVGRDDDARRMVDIAYLACELAGASTKLVTEVEPHEPVSLVKRLSCMKLRATGWAPRVALEDGMAALLESLR